MTRLPVFSWEALHQAQAELGLKAHPLPSRIRLAIARCRRGPSPNVTALVAAALLWLDAQMRRAA